MTPRREVCFLLDHRERIFWVDTGNSPLRIADSRARWTAIWDNRSEIAEIAHSHPLGPLSFSAEDETTIEAVDRALGRQLRYSVLSPNRMIARQGFSTFLVENEPWWANLLRAASGI